MKITFDSSDLFCENFGSAEPARGIKCREKRMSGYAVTFGTAEDELHSGRYATVDCGRLWEVGELSPLTSAVAQTVREIAADAVSFEPRRVLVAAFGNDKITADSIGSRAADMIVPAGRDNIGGSPEVYVIKTGVPSAVGMDSAEVTSIFARHLRVQLIICIDALAASAPSRLGTVIQVTDAGIAPGSGVSSRASAVSSASMGIPVVAVGIPTVIRESGTGVIYTCAEAERLAYRAAAVIAGGVNGYLYGK